MKINEEYDIFIDVAITNSPENLQNTEPKTENFVRLYISPTNRKTSIHISEKLQKVIPNDLISNLEIQILKKYSDRKEIAKGIIISSNSFVSHLSKKGLLEKREPSQSLAYLIFVGLILFFILLIWINNRSKNRMKLNDIWTDAYHYE